MNGLPGNWHDTGGNAAQFKGSEEEALREHEDQAPERFKPAPKRGSEGPETRKHKRAGRLRWRGQPD